VVCPGGNDADLDSVLWVPSGESIKDIDVLSRVEVIDSSFTVDLESVLATSQPQPHEYTERRLDLLHLDVDRTPPNIILTSILKNDSLVFGRATSLLSRKVDQSTTGRNDGSFIHDSVFVQGSNGGISLFRQLGSSETSTRTYLDVNTVEVESSL
jgi:hypothetical protein